MKSLSLNQGSAEWHDHRAAHFNASDAPAMLGCSPYMTRSELLHAIHTGIRPEPSPDLQRRYDKGHAIEAAKRPVAEAIVGEDLYPVVGCEGKLSASFDGLTMLHHINWECKSLNADLRAALPNAGPDDNDAAALPKAYRVQMEQQCLISGATRVLFTASNGTDDDRHCWYSPDPALRAEIVAGWKQFAEDLAAFVPQATPLPAATGHAPESLPALRIEVTGMVTASNLDDFRDHALSVFKGINRTLTTDTDFADAEKTVKWCADVEDRLKAAKQHALSQTESIDALFRTIDEIGAEARTVRLDLDKLVKARKEAIRGEIVAGGIKALADHVAGLNKRLGQNLMLTPPADFGGRIKGLKTVASIRDAVDGELARAKIYANELADRIQVNLAALAALKDHPLFAGGNRAELPSMFVDLPQLVLKAPEDCAAVIAHRVAGEQQRQDAERERIRTEEAAKLQREQEARDRELARIAALADAEAARPAPTPAPAAIASPAPVSQAAVANVVPLGTRAPVASAAPPSLSIGEINRRLNGYGLTAATLERLGFKGERVRGAVLYQERDFTILIDTMIADLRSVQEQFAQQVA